ncbi:MAG: hypothetical protein AAFR68_16640 [Pseudomonadota bacterium]
MAKDEMTTLPVLAGQNISALFDQSQQVDDILDKIEAEVRAESHDVTTLSGRKAIASLAHKVARTKTAMDNAGKDLNEDARAKINAVDAERRKIRTRLDDLKVEVRAPLNEWEAAEEERKAEIDRRLAELSPDMPENASAANIANRIEELRAVEIDDAFGEKQASAAVAKDTAIAQLRQRHANRLKYEEDRAELARLRECEAAQKAREAEAEAKRKAAEEEAARKEAEERHQRELEEAKAQARFEAEEERLAVERERQEAEQREAEAKRKAEADQAARAEVLDRINAHIMTIQHEDVAQAIMDGEIPHVSVTM